MDQDSLTDKGGDKPTMEPAEGAHLDAVDALWMPLARFFSGDSYDENLLELDQASPYERAVALALLLDLEVVNGGFLQYLSNTDGAYAGMTIEALELLGDEETNMLLKRALTIFRELDELTRQFDEARFERSVMAFATAHGIGGTT